MKKFLFLFFLLFFLFNVVNADTEAIALNVVEDGYLLESSQNVFYSWGTGIFSITVLYVDDSNNVIESYILDGGRVYGVNDYDNPGFFNFYIAETCLEAYDRFSKNAKIDGVETWCNKLSLYSSESKLKSINYWKKYSSNKDELSDYCVNDVNLVNSTMCNNLINFNGYMPIFVFREYAPVSFELVCEPKKVKKGETSNCDLVIKAEEEVNKITIPMISELFNVDKYKEVEGWTLVGNDDGTVTITSENGFKGEGVVLGATVTFKEDLLDDVDIELNDIKYTTVDGIELNSSAKDSVNIYEEQVSENVESEDEIVDNPDTLDGITLGLLVLLVVTYFLFLMYRNKKYLER